MIRTARVIFCDNEHGFGDVTFPSFDRDITALQQEFVGGQRPIWALRREAKKEGWGRMNGGDYCPQCMEDQHE